MKVEEIFKVVMVEGGLMVSFNGKPKTIPGTVEKLIYRKNRTTRPQMGLLYAFRTYVQAHRFLREYGLDSVYRFEIWKATGETTDVEPWLGSTGSPEGMEFFWEYLLSQGYPYYRGASHAPSGTVLCKKITLKERLLVKEAQDE